eukprot:CAMPEP_0184350006 /NCGR_PEP_ID=MMETSP1089-20130417/37416_1 /TAXON_ID=38269 ORGANISM="Gloeochaete wittrockiana, Strain SAG46.84" /NCGR_SAMPLE_ID=MMETSP1089 /ASSEMBLY_ACC=CAM_ASM_000445 /LENGTH=193 /DNA_ID=CAMNT_0026682547 /DNA_START=13 /DNA_END=594 /DNA_ORIENTATION=-
MTFDSFVVVDQKEEQKYAAIPMEVLSAIPQSFVPAAATPNVVFVDTAKPIFTTPSKRCIPTYLILLFAFVLAEILVVYTAPVATLFAFTFQLTLAGVIVALLFVTPRRLEIYNDRLVVRFGPCFSTTTNFKDIVHVEPIKFAPFTFALKLTTSFRNMVLVHRKGCLDLLVTPEDAEQFISVLRTHALSGTYNA